MNSMKKDFQKKAIFCDGLPGPSKGCQMVRFKGVNVSIHHIFLKA